MNPSKPKVRKLVKALRSGKYKQIKGHLRSQDGFCCLGVACEIFRRETKIGRWKRDGVMREFMGDAYTIPAAVRDWFGFECGNPILGEEKHNLGWLNDEAGLSFGEIADQIEGKWLKHQGSK